MNEKQLHALAAEFAKTLKTPEDLNQFSRMLKKITCNGLTNCNNSKTVFDKLSQNREQQNG